RRSDRHGTSACSCTNHACAVSASAKPGRYVIRPRWPSTSASWCESKSLSCDTLIQCRIVGKCQCFSRRLSPGEPQSFCASREPGGPIARAGDLAKDAGECNRRVDFASKLAPRTIAEAQMGKMEVM